MLMLTEPPAGSALRAAIARRPRAWRGPLAGAVCIVLGACGTPYLMQAGLLAGGLDGIARRLDPGRRLDVDMYVPGAAPLGVRRLPLNLLDALRAFEASTTLREALASEFVDSYVKLRVGQWNDYMRHLTDWEREHTLDV